MDMDSHEDSEFIRHEPCPSCGSRDNLARYDDGHGFCFGCGHYEHKDGCNQNELRREMLQGKAKAIPSRKLSQATCNLFSYEIGKDEDKAVHIANYYDDQKNLIAQKVRTEDKKFYWNGDASKVGLYGQWLWRHGGKMVTITEGELDALSVSQAVGNKYPVCSIASGVTSAPKSIKKQLEWLESFDRINICFDQDDVGKMQAKKVAGLFSVGKAYIVNLPKKDASEMLVADLSKELVDCVWSAKPYHPDGIVSHKDMWDYIRRPKKKSSKPYPL